MNRYIVTISGFSGKVFEAETLAKAKYAAFKSIREAGYLTDFRVFLSKLDDAYRTYDR